MAQPNDFARDPQTALLLIDLQKDFMPAGAMAVPSADQIIPLANRYIKSFSQHQRPIIATRDWHPPNHCSFKEQGGPWPPHCIAGTPGAEFADELELPDNLWLVSKGTDPEHESYSGFDHNDLAKQLSAQGIKHLLVGGVATDYCILHSVNDALRQGFAVTILQNMVKAVNVQYGDGKNALALMQEKGAKLR